MRAMLLTLDTGSDAFARCLSITTALLRGPTSGATEGAGPLGLALLIAGIVLLLVLLAGVVFWRARRTTKTRSK